MKTIVMRDDFGVGGGLRVVDSMERGGMDVDMENGSQVDDDWRETDVAISVES